MIKKLLILITVTIVGNGCVGTMKIADKPKDEVRGIVTKPQPNLDKKQIDKPLKKK